MRYDLPCRLLAGGDGTLPLNDAKTKEKYHAEKMKPLTHEWGSMMGEDMYADRLRGFLTANENVLAEIRAADVFDADGSGEIDAKEFQQLAYEVGELMDKKQIAQALKSYRSRWKWRN